MPANAQYDKASAEGRFLAGALDLESALREVAGPQLNRPALARLVHSLAQTFGGPAALSTHDEQLLDESGFTVDQAQAAAAHAASDLRMQELVHTSLSVAAAAERLGVAPPRIRQRIGDRTLWAFKAGRNQLLPPVQFTENGTLPHLEVVLRHIPAEMHPLAVQNLLTLPNPNLILDGVPASIARFLAASAGSTDDLDAVEDVVTTAMWESA